jgi:hypothetical protein
VCGGFGASPYWGKDHEDLDIHLPLAVELACQLPGRFDLQLGTAGCRGARRHTSYSLAGERLAQVGPERRGCLRR